MIYLSYPQEGCLAELRRNIRLSTRPARPGPRTVYSIEVDELRALDLSTDEQLGAIGLTRSHIEAEAPTDCQEVGRLAHFLNYQGVHAPSATGEGYVLAVFQRRLDANQLKIAGSHELTPENLTE